MRPKVSDRPIKPIELDPMSMKADRPSVVTAQLTTGQRALLRHKIHIRADALTHSRGDGNDPLPSAWRAAIEIAHHLRPLPEDALLWWAQEEAGHILITADESGYRVDGVEHGGESLRGVVCIPLRQIVEDGRSAAIDALMPLDHLLGCGGSAQGRWLSDGGDLYPRWARIGRQIAELFALGYGLSERGCGDPHVYLAEGLWMAIHDRRRLNSADPKLERLVKSSLLSPPFWGKFRRELRSSNSMSDSSGRA